MQNNRATSWRRHQVQEPPKPSMTASLWCLAALAVDQDARAEYYITPRFARSHGCACTQVLYRAGRNSSKRRRSSHIVVFRVHEDAPGSTQVHHACSASACPPGLRGTRKGRYATLQTMCIQHSAQANSAFDTLSGTMRRSSLRYCASLLAEVSAAGKAASTARLCTGLPSAVANTRCGFFHGHKAHIPFGNEILSSIIPLAT